MKSLEMAHLTSRNSENASASGGKPPDPPPLLGVVILHIGMMEVLKLLIWQLETQKMLQLQGASP